MATLETLHAAVLAAPAEEAPRLAYSDAVAASDVALAEFIKLQIVLARWNAAHEDPPARPQTSARAAVLRDQHGKRWAASIAPLVDGWSFGRGFVERISIDAARFLATAPQLYRTAPILHLDLANAKPHAAALFASPHLARIQTLSLHDNQLDDADIALLAKSPYLGAVRWLKLSSNAITSAGIESLAATDRLGALAYVNLDDNPGENPVPELVDAYSGGDTPLGIALQARFGPRRWLSSANRYEWPPDRDAVE